MHSPEPNRWGLEQLFEEPPHLPSPNHDQSGLEDSHHHEFADGELVSKHGKEDSVFLWHGGMFVGLSPAKHSRIVAALFQVPKRGFQKHNYRGGGYILACGEAVACFENELPHEGVFPHGSDVRNNDGQQK